MHHRFHFWYVAFSLFFALLIAGGFWYLHLAKLDWYDTPTRDLVIMSLATFRLTRLFTYDKITDFAREWLMSKSPDSFLRTIGELLTCPWCTGLWFAGVVVFSYFASEFAWPVLIILAIAAAGSFLQILANLIGWHAEGKKVEVKQEGAL